jgi:hypothetical protein
MILNQKSDKNMTCFALILLIIDAFKLQYLYDAGNAIFLLTLPRSLVPHVTEFSLLESLSY